MSAPITRRQFGLGAGVSSLALLAGCGRRPRQGPPPRTARIGVLLGATGSSVPIVAFRDQLAELGYTEGQDITVELRAADGHAARLPALAAELAGLPVDIMVAAGDPAIRAAKQAHDTVPIVMAASRDPVGEGLVNSLARPGGNLTGLSFFDAQLAGKRLELLKEAVPAMSRVGVMGSSTRLPEYRAGEVVAPALGVQLRLLEVHSPHDLASAFDVAARGHVDGLIIAGGNPTFLAYTSAIAGEAMQRRLPSMSERTEFVQAGGLMAYGPNIPALWRRAAYYVDRILRGAKPADLPVEQPMTFDFVVNMKTARELGITFPQEILLQVTAVIE